MEHSFGLLKPDCIKRGLEDAVLAMIRSAGLKIIASKRVRLAEREVAVIWAPCVKADFYPDMVEFSTSGDCIVFIVRGENAITRLNKLVGHYDPMKAEEGSIRYKFGTSLMENLIHSTGTEETFREEASLFFAQLVQSLGLIGPD